MAANLPTKAEIFEELGQRPYIRKLREGDYRPEAWFYAKPGTEDWGSWGMRAKPSRRGRTLMDIDAVDDAEVPDTAPPRGWGVNEK